MQAIYISALAFEAIEAKNRTTTFSLHILIYQQMAHMSKIKSRKI